MNPAQAAHEDVEQAWESNHMSMSYELIAALPSHKLTLHPTPYALRPTPYSLRPILHPVP